MFFEILLKSNKDRSFCHPLTLIHLRHILMQNPKIGDRMKKACLLISLAFIASLMMGQTTFADGLASSRIIPENKVIIHQDGKVIGEYTREATLPVGAALSCEGRCGVRLETIHMLAEDQTLFSIDTTSGSQYLNIKNGKIFFAFSKLQQDFVFVTPLGAVSANQLLINASTSDGTIKGYIKVDDESSEIGIVEGGSLKLLTKDTDQLLKPGQKFILAQTDMGGESPTQQNPGNVVNDNRRGGWLKLSGGEIVGFTVAGAATAGTAWGIGKALFDDDDDDEASPSSP